MTEIGGKFRIFIFVLSLCLLNHFIVIGQYYNPDLGNDDFLIKEELAQYLFDRTDPNSWQNESTRKIIYNGFQKNSA